MNLLKETIEFIDRIGYDVTDIVHIGNEEYGCTFKEFEALANIEYNDGFGGQEIASDLKIVFKDGNYMFRSEYDGSEWWDFKRPFIIPDSPKKITRLKDDGIWETLAELHEED